MPLEYQAWIVRKNLRDNPDKLYVFGDNFKRVGFGGQAAEMRGERNAFGIATKYSPSVYFGDEHLCLMAREWAQDFGYLIDWLLQGKTIVWPSNGIGTGLADLPNRAPQCWVVLSAFIDHLASVAKEPHAHTD